jgi:hypothetical protein
VVEDQVGHDQTLPPCALKKQSGLFISGWLRVIIDAAGV